MQQRRYSFGLAVLPPSPRLQISIGEFGKLSFGLLDLDGLVTVVLNVSLYLLGIPHGDIVLGEQLITAQRWGQPAGNVLHFWGIMLYTLRIGPNITVQMAKNTSPAGFEHRKKPRRFKNLLNQPLQASYTIPVGSHLIG